MIGGFVAIGTLGSLAGNLASARLPQAALRKAFAVFLLAVGLLIVVQNGARLLDVSEPAAPAELDSEA